LEVDDENGDEGGEETDDGGDGQASYTSTGCRAREDGEWTASTLMGVSC
jgi:hypothetical protein